MRFLERTAYLVKRAVAALVGALLLWMILLSFVQLLLRWFTSSGIIWADIQLRQMVLWIGLLGGVLAAAENRHIRINLVEHFLHGKIRMIVEKAVQLLSAGLIFYLGWLSLKFIHSEKGSGQVLDKLLFGLSVPVWTTEIVIPVCFFLMCFYFLVSLCPPALSQEPEKGERV